MMLHVFTIQQPSGLIIYLTMPDVKVQKRVGEGSYGCTNILDSNTPDKKNRNEQKVSSYVPVREGYPIGYSGDDDFLDAFDQNIMEIADRAEARMGQEPKFGRPSDYTEAMANHICSEISAGRSLRSICDDSGMPDRVTVFRWLGRHEDFRNQYARAQEDRTAAMAEDILEIADDEEC